MPTPIERLNAALEGAYRIEREVGAGGMATVYLAEDLKHHRKVALKVLKPDLAAVVGAERFLAEIETTANLQHPHILPLFDSGEADGFLFYVMPYVEGETLRDRLDRERQLPVDEAVRIARAVAQALQVAHDQGVVHRDIKPGNVLLSRGEPLVADFGIALAVGAAGGRLTETGLSLGTPYYMSPEQATGDQRVGPASDIYALGCVLYEMLVGEPPFPGATAQAVLGKIISGSLTPPGEQRASVPEHVDAAVRKALERIPADRFASADELARALGDPGFRHGAAGAGAGAGSSVRSGSVWGLAGLGVGLALALTWGLTRTGPPPPPVERYFLTERAELGPNLWFDLTPDGRGLVYQAPAQGGGVLWSRRWDNLLPTQVAGTEQAFSPAVSPDGREVAFVALGELRVAPLGGGVVRTLADSAFCCPRWAPDGSIHFAHENDGIRRVPAGGGLTEVVTRPEGGAPEVHGDFQVLPGGEVAVFTVWGNPVRIEAMRLETGERTVLAPGVKPYVTPGGHLVFSSLEGQILVAPFDPEGPELTAPPVPVVDGVLVAPGSTPYPFYAVSASGDLVYWTGSDAGLAERDLVWVTRDGVETVVDPDWRRVFWTPAISPDGGRLAVAVDGGDGRDLWIKQLDRGPHLRLTFPAGHDHRPWWSPDGRWLLFITERGETRDVMRKRADGVGEAEVVLDLPDPINQAFYSPDGEWLVYRTGRVDALDIFARRVTGDTTTISIADAPDVNEHSPALSPDGRWLAYVSDESGGWELYVRPFPDVNDGRWLVSTQGATEPLWSPDGRELFYRSGNGDLMVTQVAAGADGAFSVGASEPLFSASGYYAYPFQPQYAVGPDGERFLMIRTTTGGDDDSRMVLVRNWLTEVEERVGPGG